jgi:hypothetical protein
MAVFWLQLDEEYEEKHRAVQEAFNRVSEEKDSLKARVVTLERDNKELTVKELEVEEEFNKVRGPTIKDAQLATFILFLSFMQANLFFKLSVFLRW